MKYFFSILLLWVIAFTTTAQNHKRKGFVFDTKTYNFGDVEQWHNQPAIFTFTNKTNHLVSILPLFKENNLDVIVPSRPIKVGESVLIKAMYYTPSKGPMNLKFPVYFGSMAEPVYLHIVGNIKSLSPEAYIACPMSKPETAKQRIELIGDVAEIDTEIPLSGTVVEIVGLQNNKNITLYTTSRGKFGVKLPVGNYQVTVSHPNYYSYTGPFYIGQTSPPLRIRLTPVVENPVFAHNNIPLEEENNFEEDNKQITIREKENNHDLNFKDETLKTSSNRKEPSKKLNDNKPKENEKSSPKRLDRLDRNINYSNEKPKDNPYSKEEDASDVPKTLTTYKTSEKDKNDTHVDPEISEKKDIQYNDIEEDEKKKVKKPKKEKEEEYIERKIDKPKKDKESKTDKTEDKYKKEKKEPKEKRVPKEKIVKEKIVIPTNLYAFRVLDSKTLEPIDDASVYVHDIYNKQNKHKDHTNERGYVEMEITKNDYRFLASADGYISNETRILKEDKSDVFRILLSPVSDLFNEIYEANKAKQKDDDEVLEKFSFGNKDFSFAKDEKEKEPELLVHENVNKDYDRIERELDEEKRQREEDLILEQRKTAIEKENRKKEIELAAIEKEIAEKKAKRKEDSLHLVIAELAIENNRKEQEIEKVNLAKKEQEKIDSLNLYIATLLAKNNNLEKDLDKTKNEKDDLINQNKRNIETIDELNTINKEIEEKVDDVVLSKNKYVANNILFLIDVSTSMSKSRKMEMLQKSIKNLAGVLRDIDRVAVITYNQKTNVVLESVSGNRTSEIIAAIDSLKTGGLTNGVRGITSAYEMLEYYFIPGGNNQIILATDGLFSKYNNEMTEYELNRLVKKQAEKDMKLTVVGFGKEEDGKDLMTKLAKNGSGQYIQIKNDYMTNDVLIREIKLNSEKK